MTWLDVTLTGATEATDLLEGAADRVADLAPVLDAIHASFLAAETARFDTEGPGWAALAESTLANKARKGWPDTILEATGALRDSLTVEGATGSVWDVTPLGAVMGTDLKVPNARGRWEGTALAWFHQTGTDRMPARPVIDPTAEAFDAWPELIADWVTGSPLPTAAT